ncbi:MAG: GNAT family N-acetyltransferase [Defluviitaleaceae bacterium]|nr:GNAT family N-acetyltransferase [Defluviitaleaceae bacterium]
MSKEPLIIIEAKTDPDLYVALFNGYVAYAPYAIQITKSIFERHIIGFAHEIKGRCLIGKQGAAHGIIHFGIQERGNNISEGFIYLIFSDSNQLAQDLTALAEEWFAQNNIEKITAYLGGESPYQYILHGAEPYCWAGNYHANNAFTRMGYDLSLDILVMSMEIKGSFAYEIAPDFKEEMTRNDDLALAGTFTAHDGHIWAGVCGYHYLKEASRQFGKKYGQINIWLNNAYHGTGIAQKMMAAVHSRLAELGVSKILLATNQALYRAVKFYEKLGYAVEPIRAYSYVKRLR